MARFGEDPKAALIAEVMTSGIALVTDRSLPTYEEACVAGVTTKDMPDDMMSADEALNIELRARFDKHIAVDIGFVERLVLFWSNHFAMAYPKSSVVRGTIGDWERRIIRGNVLGRFSDMLAQTMRHPAMIAYLDNEQSIGDQSVYGKPRRVSYTENLAREILELHTLGAGNYDEDDVKALSKMLTGWSYVRARDADLGMHGGTNANRGQFIFRSDWHQPERQVFLGTSIPDTGQGQAEAAFEILARRPETATKLATKLVRHFITDNPTPEMIQPLVDAFGTNGGDLRAMSLALLELPEAWSESADKLRTPYEYLIGMFRAMRARFREEDEGVGSKILGTLNHDAWDAPSPEGFPDDTQYWLSPQAVSFRIDAAQLVARAFSAYTTVDSAQLARDLYGLSMSTQTRERVTYAGSQTASLTILFSSPEFQRR